MPMRVMCACMLSGDACSAARCWAAVWYRWVAGQASGQAERLPSGLVERGQPNWWEGRWDGRQEAGACCWVEVVWLEGRQASMICYITYCRGYYIGHGIV